MNAVWSLQSLVSRCWLHASGALGRSVRIAGRVSIRGGGRLWIGDRVWFDAATAPIELIVLQGAELVIGEDVYLRGGTSIEAERSISIGARSRVDAFCKIMDSHFHPLTGNRHRRVAARSVMIEEDVEIGARSIIAAGAHLARRTTVAPASLVTRRFPPGVTLAGVPASVRR
jgi:acetyltransferase-like isoleucine patch superfamily enzyme